MYFIKEPDESMKSSPDVCDFLLHFVTVEQFSYKYDIKLEILEDDPCRR